MKTLHIIIAFCAGLLLGHLLVNQTQTNQREPLSGKSPQLEKARVIDSVKTAADTLLKRQEKTLRDRLQMVSHNLEDKHRELQRQRNKLTGLLARIEPSDSAGQSKGTGSLVTQLEELHTATDSVLCAYETKISVMDTLIAVRDSQLLVCERAYYDYRNIIKEQAIREAALTSELNKVLREQKRQRFKNKALALGMLFVSGVATSLIVKSRQ